MTETRILLVRHGQTGWNEGAGQVRYRGQTDIPLDKVGHAQARALALRLSSKSIAGIYTSPLQRAVQTAGPAAERLGLTVTPHPGLLDMNLGEWQGRVKAEVEREEPELWDLWMTDPDRWSVPGAESLAGVRERAVLRTLALVPEFADRRFVIVSHRSVLKLLAGALLGMAGGYFWKFYLDNAGYSVLGQRGDGFVLLKWNEACHLRERVVERY